MVGRSSHEDFQVTKDLDHLSPHLLAACAAGERLTQVVLEVHRPSDAGEPAPWFRFTLHDVVLTSVLTSFEDAGPLETVTMSYAAVSWAFEGHDPPSARTWVVHAPSADR